MAIKSLENIGNLCGELWKLKKYAPEITSAFRYFDQDKNPKESLEKIINTTRKNPVLDDLFKVSKTYDMTLRSEKRAKERGGWGYACREALKEIGVNYEVRGAKNIPANGGGLLISNHPYGLLDSILLVAGLYPLINKEGRQLKIIVMNQLRFIEGLEKIAIFVHSTVKGPNTGSLRKALRYLDGGGGNLAIYPSGRMSKTGLEEYPWKKSLKTFVSHSKYVVPMWFSGPDHANIYNFLAKFKITEKLRRVFSLREVWDNAGQTVVLNIGKPISCEELISPEELKEKRNNGEIVQHLREKAEALKVAV